MIDIYESIRRLLVPIRREGHPFIAIALIAALALGYLWTPLFWILLIVALWVCYFFRDPERTTPVRDGLVVSPADGRVSMITLAVPPLEMGLPPVPLLRISVFMNVFDCHVNRTPVTGRIARIAYTPGLFLNADLDKASEHNERNALVIETTQGPVGVVQIAGLVARRIVDWVREGDMLVAGDRFGLIRFGSRVDVYLPPATPVLVGIGQKAVAGETPLADLAAQDAPRQFRAS